MSEKAAYRPEIGARVRVRGSDEPWEVKRRPHVGGYVVGPAGGGTLRRIVSAGDLEPWIDEAPTEEAPPFTAEEIEEALGAPVRAPEWVVEVIDQLLAEWRASWSKQPAPLRGIELAANLAAVVVSAWVLTADPARLAELAADPDRDPRPQAIGALVGVVLPVALQQQQEPEPRTPQRRSE